MSDVQGLVKEPVINSQVIIEGYNFGEIDVRRRHDAASLSSTPG